MALEEKSLFRGGKKERGVYPGLSLRSAVRPKRLGQGGGGGG